MAPWLVLAFTMFGRFCPGRAKQHDPSSNNIGKIWQVLFIDLRCFLSFSDPHPDLETKLMKYENLYATVWVSRSFVSIV